MMYIKSDFLVNYLNALEAKDEKLIMDMLTEQIASVIVNRKMQFINILNDVGYKIPDNVSDKKLANLIIDNLGKKKISASFAYLVAEENGILTGTLKNQKRKESESDKGKMSAPDAIKTISQGIALVEEELKNEEAANTLIKNRVYSMISSEKKHQKTSSPTAKKSRSGKTSNAVGSRGNKKKIVITISVIAGLTILFFVVRHFYKKKGAAAA